MPTFLENVFGRKKPTIALAAAELARAEAELAAAPGRTTAAEAALNRVADLSDAEHAAAEAELAVAKRSAIRLAAQVEQLRLACIEAKKTEDAAALRARADGASKKMAGMSKLLNRYDLTAETLAEIAEEIRAIDAEVDAVNNAINTAKRASLDAPEAIPTSTETLRSESDTFTPDQTVIDEIWEVADASGRWRPAMVFSQRDGQMVPVEVGARKRRITRIVPGTRRPGRRMESPLARLSLPASRLDGKTHWPRCKLPEQ